MIKFAYKIQVSRNGVTGWTGDGSFFSRDTSLNFPINISLHDFFIDLYHRIWPILLIDRNWPLERFKIKHKKIWWIVEKPKQKKTPNWERHINGYEKAGNKETNVRNESWYNRTLRWISSCNNQSDSSDRYD